MSHATLQQTILDKLLAEAGFSGWTESALERASEAAGKPKEYGRIAFPGGIADAVDYYIKQTDKAMVAALSAKNLPALKIRQRIAEGVWTRLELYAPHKEAVRALVSWFALPHHAPSGAKHLAHTCSLIWQAAGDTSTDYNWYTKRILLSGVYSTTLLYWLKDNSENAADTRAFLERRIEDVMKIQKAKGKAMEFFQKTGAKFG